MPTENPAANDYVQNIAEALQKARTCLKAAQQRQKAYADQNRSFLEFQVGDEVLLTTEHIPLRNVGTRKLLMKWIGPLKVVEKIGVVPVAYRLKLPAHFKIHDVFHVSLLKRFKKNDTYCPPPPALMVDGQEEFEVDEILTHKPQGRKKTDPKVKFLVRWAGYKDEHNTWGPYKNLKNAPDALNEYWDTIAVRAAAKSKKCGPDGYMAPVSKKLRGK